MLNPRPFGHLKKTRQSLRVTTALRKALRRKRRRARGSEFRNAVTQKRGGVFMCVRACARDRLDRFKRYSVTDLFFFFLNKQIVVTLSPKA